MNLFNKNPFLKPTENTKIVGKNIGINQTQKLENIRENMNKIKFNKPNEPVPESQMNVKDKIDNIKNLEKWK